MPSMTDQPIHSTLSDILLELKAIRELLTPSSRRQAIRSVGDRILFLLERSKNPAHGGCRSVLLRACRCLKSELDAALRQLLADGLIVEIEGKHGFRYELVSHTAPPTDDCPLPTPSTPV